MSYFRFLLTGAMMFASLPVHAAGAEFLSSNAFGVFQAVSAPASTQWVKAASNARITGRPYFGSLTGTMGTAPVELAFDRRAWSLKGIIKGRPVDLRVDHAAARIFGNANQGPVQLSFEWTPARMRMVGYAQGGPVDLTVDWSAGSLVGYAAGAPVRLSVDRNTGMIRGYAKHVPVQLSYDRISGRLSGTMSGTRLEMRLMNLEIGDFLQYFFLFLD